MRTLKDNPSVGVFGQKWASKTVELIRKSQICDCVSVFEYTERESLFIDQYEIFLITDFGRETAEWSEEYRDKLNQMREIIYTRSMRTILFANNDDLDVSTSLREAGCRVVRLEGLQWNKIPEIFATAVLEELCAAKNILAYPQNIVSAA